MALSLKKKLIWGSVALSVAIIGTVGTAVYLLTRPLDLEFAQEPNAVEAHEATRKLKLLSDAQTTQKKGFVRFSEVEINSFLDGRYNAAPQTQTNSLVKLVKSGVLLGADHATFVTWHHVPIFGFELPLVWQRVVSTSKSTNGWNFELESMRVGQLDIPEQYWSRVEGLLGATDSLFEERRAWLESIPLVTIAHNEISKSPEFRLYTYVPSEKLKAETPSER